MKMNNGYTVLNGPGVERAFMPHAADGHIMAHLLLLSCQLEQQDISPAYGQSVMYVKYPHGECHSNLLRDDSTRISTPAWCASEQWNDLRKL